MLIAPDDFYLETVMLRGRRVLAAACDLEVPRFARLDLARDGARVWVHEFVVQEQVSRVPRVLRRTGELMQDPRQWDLDESVSVGSLNCQQNGQQPVVRQRGQHSASPLAWATRGASATATATASGSGYQRRSASAFFMGRIVFLSGLRTEKPLAS